MNKCDSTFELILGLPIIGLVVALAWIFDVATGTRHLSELYRRDRH